MHQLTLHMMVRVAYCCCVLCSGGNPDSNTLISDMTTVICLDDYHSLDRKGRAKEGVTALAPEAQNFDLMAQQVHWATAGQGHPVLIWGRGPGLGLQNEYDGGAISPRTVRQPRGACISWGSQLSATAMTFVACSAFL
jgi:hypothetical protein